MNKKTILILVAIVALVYSATLLLTENSDADDCKDCDKKNPSSAFASKSGKNIIPPDKVLNDYLKSSIYPPNSRPLTDENVDLLDPNRRYEYKRPVDANSGIYYIFTADKHRVTGNDSITFSLEVSRGKSKTAKPIPVVITSAILMKGLAPKKADVVQDLKFSNSKGKHTCQIWPSKTEEGEEQSRFFVAIEYSLYSQDGVNKKAIAAFEYFPQNSVPARFTGSYREEVKDGSLYIYARVSVLKEGLYIFDANLFDNNSQPVAFTRYKQNLSKGNVEIPLYFFGKIFKDKNYSGSFQLKNLRGYRHLSGQNPDREIIPDVTAAYRTRSYSADWFSSEEYDSPKKQKKIELLKRLIERSN